MIRPRQVRLKLSKSQFQHCQQLSQESACVWNTAKNFFWRTDPSQAQDKKGIWLSEGALKRYTKQRFALHSLSRRRALLLADSIQAMIEKFYTNLKSARILRKENPSIRYPYKNKGWFCVHWKKKAIKIKGRYIHLSCGRRRVTHRTLGKGRQGIVFKLPVYLADCQPKCIELIWRNGYWLSVTLDLPNKKQDKQLGFDTLRTQPKSFKRFSEAKLLSEANIAAVDMGEIHAMTITDGNEAIVISGRQLRSVKRNRNRRVAQLSRLQSRCKKNSRRWQRLQAVKSRVMAECHRRTRDLNHKITRITVDWCIQHDVSKLVIGDVTGISKNTKNKKRLNKKNRQKVSQWAFYQQRQYLQYKCEEVRIETILEPEHGTSKTCPKCGNKYKPTGRNYDCRNSECNLKMHRDVIGACNIRTKHLTGVLSGNDNFKSPTVKYLRIDDPRSLKSSSGTGVARRASLKRVRRRLGISEQLTLLPFSSENAIQSGMFSEA